MDCNKRFPEWMRLKEQMHNDNTIHTFREGDIWWMAVGENVGVEINGKGSGFARPAVILRKLSRLGCFIVPLTSQPHHGSWYVEFKFGQKVEYAVLAQIRVVSVERLYRRMGKLSQSDFINIAMGASQIVAPSSLKNTLNPEIEVGD